MTGSTISLDSLSSPSPSPSPPPDPNLHPEASNAGLDTGSELSELTEEEQESDKRRNLPKKSKKSGSSDEGDSFSRYRKTRKNNSIVPGPMWNWVETKSSSKVVEEEEEEEVAEPPRAMEEEEEDEELIEEGEEDGANGSHNVPNDDDDPPVENPSLSNGADEDEYASEPEGRKSMRSRSESSKQRRLNAVATKNSDLSASLGHAHGLRATKTDEEDDNASDNEDAANVESDNDTQFEDDDEDIVADDDGTPLVAGEVTPGLTSELPPKANSSALLQAAVDVTAPAPEDIAPLNAAAAASSIIGATSVINPPSTSPSTPASSRSASPVSSRSASPVLEDDADEVADGPQTVNGASVAADIGASNHMDVDVPEASAVDEQENDADVDEQDLEVESDLQPAHRAEALDVLARIELRFALLRERVYVEKMEALAWEESLVNDDIHPELIHLQNELTNRRNKRLQLAERKREYEIENVRKRRRSDEAAVWSWWKFSRDELQTDMISEVNRKRRRLERERRAFERPHPVRRIPVLPRDLPHAPSIRKIIKAYSAGHSRLVNEHRAPLHLHQQKLSYPELSALDISDVAQDLDFLYQARLERERGRGGIPNFAFDHNRHLPVGPSTAVNGVHVNPTGYENYDAALVSGANPLYRPAPFQGPPNSAPLHPNDPHSQIAPPSNPSYNGVAGPRSAQLQPHVVSQPPMQTMGVPQSLLHGYPPPAPPLSFPHGQDMVIGGPPGGQMLPHVSHPSSGPQHHPRRSPSPVTMNGSMNPLGPGKSGWDGSGPSIAGPYQSNKGEWDRDKREKERDLKERDLIEADRLRESHHAHQPLPPGNTTHRHPQAPHSHSHSIQTSHRHSNGAHHHHHRHVHVHHHHHQPSPAPPPSGRSTPPPMIGSVARSPRRELDGGRTHMGHGQHPPEVLSLSKPTHSHSWKVEELSSYQPHEHRDARNAHLGRPHLMNPDDHDRPAPLPFSMSSSTLTSPPHQHQPSVNGTSSPNGPWEDKYRHGPGLPPPGPSFSIPPSAMDERVHPPRSPSHRYASGSAAALNRDRGPPLSGTHNLQPSRQDALGLSPPRPSVRDGRPLVTPASPGPNPAPYPNSQRSPSRYGSSGGLGSHREPLSSAHPSTRSPPINLKMGRPGSPLSSKLLAGPLPPPGPSSSYSPHLSGPGRTMTPTGRGPMDDVPSNKNTPLGSSYPGGGNPRTSSPFAPYPSSSNSQPSLTNAGGPRSLLGQYPGSSSDRDRDRDWIREREREWVGDRDREREQRLASPPPHLGPPLPLSSSKMSVPQMVEGR